MDKEGREWKKLEEIRSAFVQFYDKLFMTGETQGDQACLMDVGARVMEEMNVNLLRVFTMADIEAALS